MMNEIKREIHKYQLDNKNNAAMLMKQRESQHKKSLSLVEPALDNYQLKP
jgi:hypothetical protein